jgi:hypothetical protein
MQEYRRQTDHTGQPTRHAIIDTAPQQAKLARAARPSTQARPLPQDAAYEYRGGMHQLPFRETDAIDTSRAPRI